MGSSIIVALPKLEEAKKIADLLTRRGYDSVHICNTAAAVLAKANELDHGVVICSKNLSDMYYVQLAGYLPRFFEILLLTKAPELEEAPPSVLMLRLPIKSSELLNTLQAMITVLNNKFRKYRSGPRQRSAQEQKAIDDAKMYLMESKEMTEQEAFRYIQKTSMDSGTNMVECAQMILMMK